MSYIKAYEYQSSVNPPMGKIEIVSENYKDIDAKDSICYVDLSVNYKTDYKATTPNLLAGFINVDTSVAFSSSCCPSCYSDLNATSHFFYVIEGNATFVFDHDDNNDNNNTINASAGSIVISPSFEKIKIISISSKSYIYYVNDSPLLNYLGAKPDTKKKLFKHCCFTKEFIHENLELLSNKENNRKGILLGNADTEKSGTRTITHTLWALYNELPAKTNQRIHKHNSVAIDYCVFSPDDSKVYTLIGEELDGNGDIINPKKIYWKSGTMFITPPGLWHSHHNETGTDAYVLPIQDAGLLIYQRILGIVLK